MNRLLILLCMTGWALYVVHTNSNRVAQHGKASQFPATQTVTLSIEPQLLPIASGAARSPHAITPDETPQGPAANAPVPPQTQVTDITKPPSDADQNLASGSRPNQEPEKQLSVTSETIIRNGPSDSAEMIGRAHAGATLRVKSSEAGWVQFVDPVANETGWISMAYLRPTDAVENILPPPKPAKLKTPKAMPKVAKLKTPKPLHKPNPAMRHIPPIYAQLPEDREFTQPRRGGLFGLFWRRRFGGDDGG
jgi:Bacterial SH3 domain